MKSIKEQVEYLRDFVVDEKNALFDRLIQERTDYVTVVLEDLFQSHNQSAVMRSADCYGKIDGITAVATASIPSALVEKI